MSKIIANRDDIEAIANKIRYLSKIDYKMNLKEMQSVLSRVSANGIELPPLNNNNIGDASDLLRGKQLINQFGEIVTGTIPSQATQIITPTTSNQIIESGTYLSGAQTILGDPNLISDNIKSGVSIFGVSGSYKGSDSSGSGEFTLQEKTVSPTTSSQTITADNGYYGLSEVTVNAIPGEYIVTDEIAQQDDLIDRLGNVLSELSRKNIGGDSSFVDSELPPGYIKVDYIKFTGEQAINSEIVCDKNTKIKVLFTRDDSTSQYLYGVANSGNTASVTAYLSTNGGAWRFGNKSINRTISANENIIRTAIVSGSNIVSDSGTSAYSSVSDFKTIGSLFIGACRMADGSISGNKFTGKIFAYEIWQKDRLVFKIIPVVDANGVYRFWDVVSKKFATTLTEVAFMGGNL